MVLVTPSFPAPQKYSLLPTIVRRPCITLPPYDHIRFNARAHKVHRLKRELQDLSAGTTRLEEASFIVSSASVPRRPRGAAGGGGMATRGSNAAAVHGRWTKPSAAAAAAATAAGDSAALGAGTGSSGPSAAVDRRSPRPSGVRGRSTARPPVHYSPAGLSGQPGGGGTPPGTEEEEACASTEFEKGTGRPAKIEGGGVNPAKVALQVDTESASGSGAGAGFGGAGEGTARSEARMAQPRDIFFSTERENLLPCPFSGILDMSEPLRKQSFFSGAENVRTSSPTTGGGSEGGVHVGVEVLKCAVDSDGFVRHAESCVLRDASPRRASTSGLLAFKGKLGENVSQEPGRIRVPLGDLPVRKWSSVEGSEWDLVAVDSGTGAQTLFSRVSLAVHMRGTIPTSNRYVVQRPGARYYFLPGQKHPTPVALDLESNCAGRVLKAWS